ncbi:MAG: alpha/beta hydrolase [Pseudomonadota bacterium]
MAFPKKLTSHFATNRNRLRDGTYGTEFYEGDPRLIRLGKVEVKKSGKRWKASKPETHPERSRAAAGASRADREWVVLGSTASFDAVRTDGIESGTTDILIFLHGAGNSFETAAETLAVMAELYSDADNPVCPYFFTYPANGKSDPANYFADRDDAALSGPAMARSFGKLITFLTERHVEERCGARIHLLAHSLGNFALRKAVETIFANPAYRPIRLFDTVFLAHADDDKDTLSSNDKMRNLTRLTDRIVVYYDGTDKLLRLSDAVHMDRLGQKGPSPFPGVHVNGCEIAAVDCSETKFDVMSDRQRHRHYLGASKVINDIRAVMRHQEPKRTPLDRAGFWRL